MSEKVKYEIQVEKPKSSHGWKAIGDGRDGRLYFNENKFIETKVDTVEEARKAIKQIRADWKKNWITEHNLRIVKITVVTTYDVVE